MGPLPEQIRPVQGLPVILILGLGLAALYGLVGLQSWGFDDEFLMLRATAAAPDIAALSRYLVEQDVHPLGSYLILWLGQQAEIDPSHLRALAGVLTAAALVVLWGHVAPRARGAAAFAFLVICLNPTLLHWGATLRWYSWSLPIIALMLVLVLRNPSRGLVFWGGLAAGGATLAHIGYPNLLILPGFLIAGLLRRRGQLRQDLPALGLATAGFAVLVVPQILFVMLRQVEEAMLVHGHSLFRRITGLGLHVFGGQASMPLGLSALAFTAGNLTLFGLALRNRIASVASPGGAVLLPGLAAFFTAGLTGHFRTLVVLSPAQAIWQAQLFTEITGPRARGLIVALFGIGTAAGLWNVILREDTTKSGWNMPVAEILREVDAARSICAPLTVFTYDPILAWHMDRRGDTRLISYDEPLEEMLASHPTCLLVIRTYHRDMDKETAAALESSLAGRGTPLATRRVGLDRHAWFKRYFDPQVPDHAAILSLHGPLP